MKLCADEVVQQSGQLKNVQYSYNYAYLRTKCVFLETAHGICVDYRINQNGAFWRKSGFKRPHIAKNRGALGRASPPVFPPSVLTSM